jgi:predicted DCC family thiol-disulfide oxidoreductase YuxK
MIDALSPERRVAAALRSPSELLVLYDADCPICVRCRHWLEQQPTFVTLTFMAAASDEARARFGDHLPWLGKELVVVGDRGQAWVGPAAFLVALWATKHHRRWSYVLSGPSLAPLAERFFHLVSSRRADMARFVRTECVDDRCRHRTRK